MTTDDDPKEILRKSAWDEAFHCYGKAFVLEQRVSRFEKVFFAYDLVCFGFPIFVGLAALSFKVDKNAFKVLAIVGSAIGFATMLFSLLCLIGRWREKWQNYQREIVLCSTLFDDYRRFGKSPPNNEYRKQFELLEIRRQEAEKGSATLTEEEKRIGYRFAARQFERECAKCGVKPTDMASTDCSVCGQFRKKFK
tara:strand:+ start:24835 stop:25419 length:585 start_codon:yes stop_codon:yes gene_type:complete